MPPNDTIQLDATIGEQIGDTRSFHVVVSTDDPDLKNQVVLQDWILDIYQTNPVVLWNHDLGEIPIGTARDVRVEGHALHAILDFATHAKAEEVFQAVRSKLVRGISAGLKIGDVMPAVVDGKDVLVLSRCILLEISVTPIPTNSHSLVIDAVKSYAAKAPMPANTDAKPVQSGLDLGQDRLILETKAASIDDAWMVVKAWKAAHEALPQVQGELEATKVALNALNESVVETKKSALFATLRTARKLTPAMEMEFKSWSLPALESFAKVAPVLFEREPSREPAETVNVAASTFQGKSFEDLVSGPSQTVVDLQKSDPELAQQVWAARREKLGLPSVKR